MSDQRPLDLNETIDETVCMTRSFEKEALEYHAKGKPGKVTVTSHKECDSEYALSLAYSPGVAAPCMEIAKDPSKVYDYTTKGNLVAVVTNGTAVLGLGNIGPLASKPVMEGKGVLFKQFANIDVFDIEMNSHSIDSFIDAVKSLEPTFGGINLEDIKAPDCFVIEDRLKKEMKIPVFHDDQHGTAIISSAALINACMLTNRKISDIKVVFNGAGAAAISCARLFVRLGANPSQVLICDSKGVLFKGRTNGMNEFKQEFAVETEARTLSDALQDADVFCGLSVGNILTAEMIKKMAPRPIIFAMANPDPEIDPHLAKKIRPDCIIATGRSDFPNQVNNVLGFPSIFRGALDVRATDITEEMKLAAVYALAELARQEVPEKVSAAYGDQNFHFGPDYIIPKPFDERVLINVAPAVAKAAMDCGCAQKPIADFQKYRDSLEASLSRRRGFVRSVINRIKSKSLASGQKPIIYFPEGRSSKILRALNSVVKEGIIQPVLLGYEEMVKERIHELELENLSDVPIIHPSKHPKYKEYTLKLYEKRKRKGIMWAEAERLTSDPYYFSAMAVDNGDADGVISGAIQNYKECVLPILRTIGTGRRRTASGLNLVLVKERVLFFADTTVNIDPSAEQISTIAHHAAKVARYFGIEPKVSLLSYSNFTGDGDTPHKMKKAVKLIKEIDPHLIVDGEMQADTAVNGEIVDRIFPFCEIKDGANILIFPNLAAGNIAYKLVQQLGGGEVLGPFLMGVKKPANVLQRTCTVDDVFNTIVLTALEVQAYQELESQ